MHGAEAEARDHGGRVTTVTPHAIESGELAKASQTSAREDYMPSNTTAKAGITVMTTVDGIWSSLASVIDPELGLDIVTLGLVYGVECDGGIARITYTLTTPGCPMERVITGGIRAAIARVDGITRVDTHIVWDPAWHPGMIAPNAFPT